MNAQINKGHLIIDDPIIKFKFTRGQGFPEFQPWLFPASSLSYLHTTTCLHSNTCARATLQYLLTVHTELSVSAAHCDVFLGLSHRPWWKRWLTFIGLLQHLILLPCSTDHAALLCNNVLLLRGLCNKKRTSLGAKDMFFWPLYFQIQHSSHNCLTTCYQYFFSVQRTAFFSSNLERPHLGPISSLWLI